MKEGEPQPQRPEPGAWDLDAVAETLGVRVVPCVDLVCGDGQRFLLTETGAQLDLYPGRRIVRYRNPYIQFDMVNVGQVRADAGQLTVQTGDGRSQTQVAFAPDGAVMVSVQPEARGEIAVAVEEGQPAAAQAAAPAVETPQQPRSQERERVSLVGRIGAAPAFRTTPKGTLVGRFPLAVRQGEKTSWHTVLMFGDRAKKLQESVKKGDAVEIVGYLHTREKPLQDGRTKTVEEIYAVVVKSR